MTQAERQAKKSADSINDSISSIGVAGYAVGNALGGFLKDGITAIAAAFPALIDQAAKFQDIADKTGGSAQGFAAFAVSAKVAGVSIDEIANASTRLSKSLLQAGDDSKPITAGLKALGISIDDFKKLKPDEQIKAAANAFGQFAEGGEKAAVAQQLFGKSGADLLKFFKDYVDNGGDVTILTDKMIQQADDYSDALTRQQAVLGLTASALATQALGAITAFTSVVKDAIIEMAGLNTVSTTLGANKAVEIFAENVGRALAGAIDYVAKSVREFQVLTDFVTQSAKALSQIAELDFAGASKTGADFRAKYGLDELGRKIGGAGAEAGKSYVAAFNAQLAGAKRTAFAVTDPRRVDLGKDGRPVDTRPVLPASAPTKKGGAGAKDDPTKKLLDNDLAAFKAQGEQAKELLSERNKILDLYNSQGLLSVKDYYAALQGNLDEATASQIKSYDDQIAALEKYKASASKQTEVADATGKINKLQEDKAKLYRQAGAESQAMSFKETMAAKAVKAAFDEVNAKVLEYQGNIRAAAEIRFDASNEKLLTQATSEHNTAIVKQIELLKQYTLAQADITKATDAFALAQGDLSIQEDRITIAQQRGTMGEIQALNASADARRAAIVPMQQQLDALLAINDAARSPAQQQAVERLKLQLEQLKATADPLGDKINGIFGDAAGSAFGDFITGAKTAKEALKGFADQVFKSFADMMAKDFGKQLFSSLIGGSSTGGAGGVGGLLSSLIGGGSKGGSIASLFGGGSSGAVLTGAGNATGADLSLAFSNGGFTGMGAANDPAGIVHKGEYVLNAAQTRSIGVANLDKGNFGGGTNVFNVNVAPSTSRDSGTQIAAQAARKLAAGQRNT